MYSCLRGDVQTLRGQGGGEVGQIQDTCKIMTRHEIYDVMAGAAYLTKFAGLIGGLGSTGLNIASLKTDFRQSSRIGLLVTELKSERRCKSIIASSIPGQPSPLTNLTLIDLH